jgi:4-amino-4-deoxy-L-arabinose transferase-like glycosyltransferase
LLSWQNGKIVFYSSMTLSLRQRAFYFIACLTVLRIGFLGLSPLPLHGDEAQYWTWAQALDFGYYSKPPMVAWAIAFTTFLGHSDTEFWVRLASPFCYAIASYFIYLTGKAAVDEKTGLWSAVLFCTLPAVFLSSTIISTDPLLLLFWSIGLYFVWQAITVNTWKYWLFCGFFVGLGLLTKYTAVLFLISTFVYLMAEKQHRYLLKTARPYGMALLAILVWLPNFVWNAQHNFLTFKHTQDNANLQKTLFHPDKLLEFLGSQFGVMGIFLFAAFLILLWKSLKNKPFKNASFFFWYTIVLWGIIVAQSLLSRANANWAAASYVAGTVWVVAWLIQTNRERWLKASLILHCSVAVIALSIPFMNLNLPAKYDVYKKLKGYPDLAKELLVIQRQYPNAAILVDDRMLFAVLKYYAHGALPVMIKWNNTPHIRDYYEMTTSLRDAKSGEYLLVVPSADSIGFVPFFQRIEPIKTITIPTNPDRALKYAVFYGRGLYPSQLLPLR